MGNLTLQSATALRAAKNAILLAFLFLVAAAPLRAADITAGHTFSNGETVTADSMNSIVGSAVINSTFYTAKTPVTTFSAADSFLLYSAGLAGFRTVQAAYLLYTNADLINALFATPDFARRSNFLAGADNTARSNFVYRFWTYSPGYTDLVAYATSPALTDLVALWSIRSNATISATVSGVRDAILTNFTSSLQTVAIDAMSDIAHGLPGAPQRVRWVLQCQTVDGTGYKLGDEVDVGDVFRSDNFGPCFFWGSNATNVFLLSSHDVTTVTIPQIKVRGGTTATNLVAGDWKAKCYAGYFY